MPGRVLYHCLVTGEFLTACCRDIGAVSVSLEDPLCCEEPEEEPVSTPEPEDSTECDCCDLLLEEGHRREAAQPPGDSGFSQTHLALVAVGVPAPSHRGLRSAASQPRLRAPPKRPRFLLFESFLS